MNEKEQQEYKQYLQSQHGFTADEADQYLGHHAEKSLGDKAVDFGKAALEKTSNVLGYIPGQTRTLLQKGVDKVSGGDAAGNFDGAQSQGWGQYMQKRGVPEGPDLNPYLGGVAGNMAKLVTGQLGKDTVPAREFVGGGMDTLSDPTLAGTVLEKTPLTLAQKIGSYLSKANPIGAAQMGLEGASFATKGAGKALAGMSGPEASAFTSNPKKVYTMAKNLSDAGTAPIVQKEAEDLLGPSLRDLGSKRIDPMMQKIDSLTQNQTIKTPTSILNDMMGHDPEMDAMIKKIQASSSQYGDATYKPIIEAPASDITSLRRRADVVADFKNNKNTAQIASSKDAELAGKNNQLRELINTSNPEIGDTNEKISSLIKLRDRANSLSGNPLNPFSTESLDQMSTLGNLANETGNQSLLDFRNQLKAARTIMGKDAAKTMSHGSVQHSAFKALSKPVGRGLLLTDEAMPFSDMIDAAKQLPGANAAGQLPPEVWSKLLQGANNGETKTK